MGYKTEYSNKLMNISGNRPPDTALSGNQMAEDVNRILTEAMGRDKRKDWIIGNFKTGDLFCLTIQYQKERGGWYVTEFVKYFAMPLREFGKMYMMGIDTMLDAMKGGDYEYCIAEHGFSKDRYMAQPYWNSLRELTNGKDGKFSFQVGRLPIDPMECEAMVRALAPQNLFAGVSVN